MITLDFGALAARRPTAQQSSSRKSLSQLSLAVARSKRIIVITGAGISCSSGIPDFRSSDGLYNMVKSRYPDVVMKGRDLFDASLFRDPTSTQLFYTFMAELKASIDAATPSPTHRFIKTLHTKGKLLRSYTQNIDGLEEQAGLVGTSSSAASKKGKGTLKNLKDIKSVQLHGDIHRVRCTICSAEYRCEQHHVEAFRTGEPPSCPDCSVRCQDRVARAARALAVGTLRPSIVLYEEVHPLGDEIGTISARDLSRRPDLLIIMGTSLKVHGIKKLVKDFASAVHNTPPPSLPTRNKTCVNPFSRKVVFINRTPPAGEWEGVIDYWVKSDTDPWVQKCEEDWKRFRPADWEVQGTLVGNPILSPNVPSKNAFKVVKRTPRAVKPAKGKGTKRKAGAENMTFPDSQPSAPRPICPLSPSKAKKYLIRVSQNSQSPHVPPPSLTFRHVAASPLLLTSSIRPQPNGSPMKSGDVQRWKAIKVKRTITDLRSRPGDSDSEDDIPLASRLLFAASAVQPSSKDGLDRDLFADNDMVASTFDSRMQVEEEEAYEEEDSLIVKCAGARKKRDMRNTPVRLELRKPSQSRPAFPLRSLSQVGSATDDSWYDVFGSESELSEAEDVPFVFGHAQSTPCRPSVKEIDAVEIDIMGDGVGEVDVDMVVEAEEVVKEVAPAPVATEAKPKGRAKAVRKQRVVPTTRVLRKR